MSVLYHGAACTE